MKRLLLWCSLLLLLLACRQSDTTSRNGSQPASDDAIKLLVEKSGVYHISRRTLERAGIEVTDWTVEQIELSTGGRAVPYLLQDDTLIFYGKASDSRYSAIHTYVLQLGKPGQLMAERATPDASGDVVAAVPQTVRVESNLVYEQRAAESGGDVWFWQRLNDVGKESVMEIEVDLPAVAAGDAELRMHLWGFTDIYDIDPDHDFVVKLNDSDLGTVVFDGLAYYTSTLTLDANQLNTGTNRLVLDNSLAGEAIVDQVYLDWIELHYPAPTRAVDGQLQIESVAGVIEATNFAQKPLLIDISDPDQPVNLTGWQYDGDTATFAVEPQMHVVAIGERGLQAAATAPLVQSELTSTTGGADLLIVTTAELAPALDPLIAAREAQGLRVVLATVEELYDAFGYGQRSPEAITSFVRFATENWEEPAPAYLFLVGDMTTDMLSYGASNSEMKMPTNIVPAPIVQVSYAGETVSDARLADIDGDKRPDLAVGRWPVDSQRQVRSLVERTLAYEAGTASEKSLFTFDGSSREFSGFTERLLSQSNFPQDNAELFDGPAASDVLQQWNNGAWLVSYVGHGSLEMWGKDEVLSVDKVNGINEALTPPIVLQFSCLTGHFADPRADSISERMLWQDGGPVLLIASTGLTLSTHQTPFALALMEALQQPTVERMGDALQAAKLSLSTESNSGLQEISDTFGLLGDPSAMLTRPEHILTQSVSNSP